MKQALRKTAAAMLLLAPLGLAVVAQPAAAQDHPYRVAASEQGSIRGISLSSDGGLRPGATLRVQVNATPDARWANVALSDHVRVPLRERAPGEYVGTYVIRRGDRIDPTRMMTVRAGWGEGPVALAFSYPPSFQSLAMGAGPASAQVDAFSMWPRDGRDVDPGEVVRFRVQGTPRAQAWVDIPGIARGVRLHEQSPGVYVGSYTVRVRDDTDNFADAVAVLRRGDRRVVAHLGESDRNYGYGYGR